VPTATWTSRREAARQLRDFFRARSASTLPAWNCELLRTVTAGEKRLLNSPACTDGWLGSVSVCPARSRPSQPLIAAHLLPDAGNGMPSLATHGAGRSANSAGALGGVERPRQAARFARLIHRRIAFLADGSLAPAGTSPSPNPRRCRRRRRRPQVHGSAAQCAVGWSWWSRMSVQCRRAEVALSKYSVASTRPASGVRVTVRCPRRCPTHPLSNVRVWTSRCPGVGCPRVRVRIGGVCTGDFMERVGAAGSHTARRARVWPSRRIRERYDHRPEPGVASAPDCLASQRMGAQFPR
jgi:hypothetical protein